MLYDINTLDALKKYRNNFKALEMEADSKVEIDRPQELQIFVVEGVVNDGVQDYYSGSRICNLRSNVLRSRTACKLLVLIS